MKPLLDSVLILDDVVPLELQNSIEQLCLSNSFPWYWDESSNYTSIKNRNSNDEDYHTMTNISEGIDIPQFVHSVYHHKHNGESYYFNTFNSLLSCLPLSIDKLLRIKLNLNYVEAKPYSIPHVDFVGIENLVTIIYYVNDSCGDTVIFNEKRNSNELPDCEKLTIKQSITPKKGRFVMFDGTYLHAGGFPSSKTPRVVLNANVIPYKFFWSK